MIRHSRSGFAAAAALGLAVLAAGCAPQGRPAPLSYGVQQVAAPEGQVRVQAGDTVYSIARRYNIPVRSLIEANNLQPPYQLTPGSVLSLTQTRTHTVARGEVLSLIARKYQVDVSALARANNLSPPYTIYPNQVLTLPGSVAPTPQAQSSQGASQPAGFGRMVLTSPNAAPGTPQSPAAPNTVAAAPPPPAAAPRLPPRGELLTPPVTQPQGPGPTESALQPTPSAPEPVVIPPRVEQTAAAAPAPAEAGRSNTVPQPPSLAGSGFIWPVKGKLLAEYGPSGRGQHNDGINIAAERGTPVRAAENGVVAYAGNELRGFGNLLLVKHANGWMSAYAHNEELMVARGDQVKRGQVIAKVGMTGGVTQPQLHFELRKGSHSVNPLDHLRDGQAALGSEEAPPS